MATFRGWGSSWGDSWIQNIDPNAMFGLALFAMPATGTLTDGATRRGGGNAKPKRGRWEVDSFTDYKPKLPTKNDDEECLLLMM